MSVGKKNINLPYLHVAFSMAKIKVKNNNQKLKSGRKKLKKGFLTNVQDLHTVSAK